MLLFLSDRIYWICFIFFSFSQFPEETEKEESRYAGEIKLDSAFSMACHNSHLWLEPSLAAFSGIGFLSFRPGRTKEQQKIVSILFILSNIVRRKIHWSFSRV
jgi:hypothetical protein